VGLYNLNAKGAAPFTSTININNTTRYKNIVKRLILAVL